MPTSRARVACLPYSVLITGETSTGKLRRGETPKQWAARVKQLGIEAACRANDAGTMRGAAARPGLSHGSLKGHLHRARCAS